MVEKIKKPNDLLRQERKNRGWSQSRLAEMIGADTSMISRWECGDRSPEPAYQEKLCTLFQKKASELGFIEQPVHSSPRTNTFSETSTSISVSNPSIQIVTPGTRDWSVWFGLKLAQILRTISLWNGQATFGDEIQIMVDQEIQMFDEVLQQHQVPKDQLLSRRQALVTIAALPATLLGVSKPHESMNDLFAEEFLPQCAASITACWHLLKGKGFVAVEEILPQYIPLLGTIALHASKYQHVAARLATQTAIMQGILAMHRLDIPARERYCSNAVRYARISQDHKLEAAAFMYPGYTYSHCYYPRQPQKALKAFQTALSALENETSLLRSDIYMGMGEAYAQCREEQEALRYIGLAQEHFPSYPEHDPSFIYADCGVNTLYQWEGKAYLRLVEHFPDAGYEQKAAHSLMQSIGVQSISERSTNETIVYQADASRVLGELNIYVSTLRQAVQMARDIGSQRRYHDAFLVYQQTPEKWMKETQIQELSKDVFMLPA